MEFSLNEASKAELKKLGVGVLYLIGSRALKTNRPDSDIDFAVVMKEKKGLKNPGELQNALYGVLAAAVSREITSKKPLLIDIVLLDTAPLYYAIAARDTGRVLMEISPGFRADFEERATIRYADFEPFRREQEKITLAMI